MNPFVLIFAMPALLWAAEAATREEASASVGDAQWLVFLQKRQPLFVELHVEIDGKPFRASWIQTMERLFEHFDRSGDSVIGDDESQRAQDWWQRIITTQGYYTVIGFDEDASSSESEAGILEPLTEGNLTRVTWMKGMGPVGDRLGLLSRAALDGPAEQLWTHLDANGDMAVSASEMKAAERLMARLDIDDDQTINKSELRPYANPYARFNGQQSQMVAATNDPPLWWLLPVSAAGAKAFAAAMLRQYDGSTNEQIDQQLTPREIGLDPADFERHDADRNGLLDVEELAKLTANPPKQIALKVEMGMPHGRPRMQLIGNQQRVGNAAPDVNVLSDRLQTVAIGNVRLQFSLRDALMPEERDAALRNTFKAMDADANAYLDQRESKQGDLASVFGLADSDKNDQVTEDEYLTYSRLDSQLRQTHPSLTTIDQGRAIFDLVDVDRDGRLSPRELRGAHAALLQADLNGDGNLQADEAPHQFSILIGPGVAIDGPLEGPQVAAVPRPNIGPRWFQKMDRNSDGDVSRREFPGTAEQFARMDADGDGLIDGHEAVQATFEERVGASRSQQNDAPAPSAP